MYVVSFLDTFILSPIYSPLLFSFFFFNDTATTEIYTLSLHDALPIGLPSAVRSQPHAPGMARISAKLCARSEEHTSELQSRENLVCRLLLEKKKKKKNKFLKAKKKNKKSKTN